MSTPEPPFEELRVLRKQLIATDILWFELRHDDGRFLPPFTAGSHITVETPSGARRNYSLCGDPARLETYQIAVRRDAQGRGGSLSMADGLAVGSGLKTSQPRNNFELDARASQSLFIAGGIGVTPILSMMRHLKRQGGADFKLVYCTRDAPGTAFAQALGDEFPGQCLIHHDGGDIAKAYDLWPALETPSATHVYCCGPRGLMDAVADMSGHWPSHQIHFESFGVDTHALPPDQPFAVRLQASQAVLAVSAEESLLQALRRCGYQVPSSCESGTCGTCRIPLVDGVADHRDMVLMDDEKTSHIMVCVSRALSAELVLDL